MKNNTLGSISLPSIKQPKLFSVLVIFCLRTIVVTIRICIVNLIRNFSELPLFILQRVGNR